MGGWVGGDVPAENDVPVSLVGELILVRLVGEEMGNCGCLERVGGWVGGWVGG